MSLMGGVLKHHFKTQYHLTHLTHVGPDTDVTAYIINNPFHSHNHLVR